MLTHQVGHIPRTSRHPRPLRPPRSPIAPAQSPKDHPPSLRRENHVSVDTTFLVQKCACMYLCMCIYYAHIHTHSYDTYIGMKHTYDTHTFIQGRHIHTREHARIHRTHSVQAQLPCNTTPTLRPRSKTTCARACPPSRASNYPSPHLAAI